MWHWIWEATTCSVNYDTNCKLLIGQKFLNRRLRPGFFNDWYSTKVFQVSAKYPVSKDRLTIVVTAGRSESRWCMTDLISLFSHPSHMSLYDGCMTISSRDKSAFKIVQQIHIIHKPIGNKGITHLSDHGSRLCQARGSRLSQIRLKNKPNKAHMLYKYAKPGTEIYQIRLPLRDPLERKIQLSFPLQSGTKALDTPTTRRSKLGVKTRKLSAL